MQNYKKVMIKKQHGRGGFTIIELLVVVAMIAVLASILLPSIGGMLQNARQVQSLSVLRNIGQAVVFHASEKKGMMPMLYINQKQPWLNYTSGTPGRIANVLEEYLGIAGVHGEVPDVLRDPAWERHLGASNASAPVLNQTYRWMVHHYQRPNGDPSEDMFPWGNPSSNYWEDPYRMSAIAAPSSTWAIADNDRVIQYPRTWSSLITEPLYDDRRCVLFFDSHVETRRVSDPIFQP